MKILFIAPLPPPTNGQSLAAETIYRELCLDNSVFVVNMAKPKRVKNLFDWIKRSFSVTSFIAKVAIRKGRAERIYLTLSESRGGNIKDLIIYLICFRQLKHMTLHMLGGAGMQKIFIKKGLIFKLNRFFIKRVSAVIVEGDIQKITFSSVIENKRIHVIPNFASNYLFVTPDEINWKFKNRSVLEVLYLSNLIFGKGYLELAEAYISLPSDIKKQINLTFVGGFQSDKFKNSFFKMIEKESGIKYLGNFIDGQNKKELYMNTNIFCLPTYYPFEGQPISILEAYATGCVVITTDHSGIPQIFKDKINGYQVEKKSANSIAEALEKILIEKDMLLTIGLNNRQEANSNYRKEVFVNRVLKVLNVS